MNNSINCTGFIEMFVEPSDNNEPHGYTATDAATESARTSNQLYPAGINSKCDLPEE